MYFFCVSAVNQPFGTECRNFERGMERPDGKRRVYDAEIGDQDDNRICDDLCENNDFECFAVAVSRDERDREFDEYR